MLSITRALLIAVVVMFIPSCANDQAVEEKQASESQRKEEKAIKGEGREEHGAEGEEHGSEGKAREEHGSGSEGEESGQKLSLNEAWDNVRKGARLILSYNRQTNSFVGKVQNSTQRMLCAVRVEVHLSNGTELGPTERTDLTSGQEVNVELSAVGENFDWWTTHAETSACPGE